MNDDRRIWPLAAAGAGLLAVGAAAGYWLRPASEPDPMTEIVEMAAPGHDHAATTAGSEDPHAGHAPSMSAVTVELTPEMAERAGIRTTAAVPGRASAELRVPGVIQPNSYKQVVVTSLVSGRLTQVRAELGMQVAAQEALATIYSPELADAQTAFISARAEQVAHGQRQTRIQRLTAIGAASREELENIEAERAMHDSNVETARARLGLLGIPEEQTQRLTGPQDVITSTTVKAPFAGVVTQRNANVGLNIDPSTPLFTIVDLSTVWVIADLFERDFARIRVGSPATITSTSYPGLTLRGRVGYIDPQVEAETRTAKLRVEVPNAGQRLRLGMYVDVHLGEVGARQGVFVPKSAVQTIGSSAVVYVAADTGGHRFMERPVEIAGSSGDQTLVVSGLQPGEQVVSEGVFFLRAERERLHAGQSVP